MASFRYHPRLPLALLGLLALCPPASPFRHGAPLSCCGSLKPAHRGVSPQSSPAPYTMAVSNNSASSLQVKIMGPTYTGILLQAREPNGSAAVGTWSAPPQNTKAIACFSTANSAITHSDTVEKNNATTYTWNPPEYSPSKVVFVATVAQSRAVYWLNVHSKEIYTPGSGSVKCMSGFAVLATFLVWSLTAF